ncbi:MAG: hypothetical protein IKS37_11160 [Solobacterium sp.]|nr:hypothetical protein [Solobacterium sp.]
MHKYQKLAAILGAGILFTACGTGAGSLPDEAYEPVPRSLFPIPDDAYVGDTMPFVTDDGTLELYYLYDTDHNGKCYHPIWKYSTKDLTSYEDHGMVLNFGKMQDPDPAIGTGSVTQDKDGKYHLFYTGHNDLGNQGKGKECVMHAVSDDRTTWTKLPEDTFFAPENYSKDDFRDPEVFWVEEENCWWMLMAGRENTKGGVTALFTSTDLHKWEYDGILYAPMAQYMLECPDIFEIDGTWYLTYSWDCVTYYAVGESRRGPFKAPADNVFDGNGFIYYAAKHAHFKDDDYLCGWLGRAALTVDSGAYQWAGNVLNHRLVKHEDGTLGVAAPKTYWDHFAQEKPFKAVKKQGKVTIKDNTIQLSGSADTYALADMGTRPAAMLLECDVTLKNGVAGFAFGGYADDPEWYVMCLDTVNGRLHYNGLTVEQMEKFDSPAFTNFDFSKQETHHVTLVCENEIVILYIDDLKAFSCRCSSSTNGAHIGVFADNCDAVFSNITVRIP